jgi:hypothetical protein
MVLPRAIGNKADGSSYEKRWRVPARLLSGPAGSEPDVRPLTPPEAYDYGLSEKLSSMSGRQILHIRAKRLLPLGNKITLAAL